MNVSRAAYVNYLLPEYFCKIYYSRNNMYGAPFKVQQSNIYERAKQKK